MRRVTAGSHHQSVLNHANESLASNDNPDDAVTVEDTPFNGSEEEIQV